MTSQEREKWNLYSCVPRCIIKLAELRGFPIAEDDFVKRFADKIPEWKNRFGLTSIQEAILMVAELRLADSWVHIPTVKQLIEFVNEGNRLNHALVVTHRIRTSSSEDFQELHHCRLLLGFEIGSSKVVLENPNQNGTQGLMTESIESLAEQLAEFVVFYVNGENGDV